MQELFFSQMEDIDIIAPFFPHCSPCTICFSFIHTVIFAVQKFFLKLPYPSPKKLTGLSLIKKTA